jgi:K+-sensing histidine kinase KdpD
MTSDPIRHSLRTVLSYAAAVISVSAALIVTFWFGSAMKYTPTPFFFCAIMVSSWFGGFWPGILASLLSTLALDYYFIPPIESFVINPEYMPNAIAFVASALFINWLNGEQKRANADLMQENRDRMKAEEGLRASEQRLQDIVDNTSAVIFVKDLELLDWRIPPGNLPFWKSAIGWPARFMTRWLKVLPGSRCN